jgi:hypothetical protein
MSDPGKQQPQAVTRAQQLVDKLWSDKTQLGADFRKAAKDLFPDINTPDEQVAIAAAPLAEKLNKVEGDLKAALERLSAKEKADDDLRLENDLAVKITGAAKEFGLTESGMGKMMARMKETGNVSDPQAAAAWVVSQMPKPEPSNTPSWLPQKADLFGSNERNEKWEKLHRDPIKYFDDELRECFRDPDKYVRETFEGTA